MKIANCDLSKNVYIIAEVGGNHNGNIDIALELVEAAADAGANAVKFQTYKAETLVHPSQEPLPIVKKHYSSQLERFKSLELEFEDYKKLIKLCRKLDIDFLTSPFDLSILQTFVEYMPAIKIASGDITFHQLIVQAAKYDCPVIVSTGMATPEEIENILPLVPKNKLALLHCVSIYPLPEVDVNLLAITEMKRRWPGYVIGYSDHTIGDIACISAVSLGAKIIEKHFTLDSSQRPGDHILSLEPHEMRVMIEKIRKLEKMLGQVQKQPAPGERDMKQWMRRGCYANKFLRAGSIVQEEDIIFIRPETDISPANANECIIGKKIITDKIPMSEFKLNDFQDFI